MAAELMNQIQMAVVRGNISEICSLGGEAAETKGVDAGRADVKVAEEVASMLAKKWQATVVISGKTDIITDGSRTMHIHNGCPEMSDITGSGCMCTTLVGAFVGAHPEDPFGASAAAMLSMGIAGERAWKSYGHQGLGHFHMGILDELGRMSASVMEAEGRYDIL